MRIEHDAVADDRQFSRPHDAGRKQAELEGHSVNDERMAGVVAALEAHDDVGALRQPVDDLAFTLVAPLRADDYDVRHSELLSDAGFLQDAVSCVTASDLCVDRDVRARSWVDPSLVVALAIALKTPSSFGQKSANLGCKVGH